MILKINKNQVGGKNRFALIGGPCVIESEKHAMKMAESIKKITDKLKLTYIFKASFDKANRTSVRSFRSIGVEKAFKILEKIKKEFNLPITTDFHNEEQIKIFGNNVDIIQVPAFLCRQTDLLLAAGMTGKIVNIKKGQFLAPNQAQNIVEKIKSTGNNQVIITERGYSFGYNNLIVDMRNFEMWKNKDFLTCYDATHSLQLPGALGVKSGGERNYIEPLARAALAIGIDFLFMEIHDNPPQALSDSETQFNLKNLQSFLKDLIYIDDYVKNKIYK